MSKAEKRALVFPCALLVLCPSNKVLMEHNDWGRQELVKDSILNIDECEFVSLVIAPFERHGLWSNVICEARRTCKRIAGIHCP